MNNNVEEHQWWQFLELWAKALENKNETDFEWKKVAADLNLSQSLVKEFISYFSGDHHVALPDDIEICMGAVCRAKGNEKNWTLLTSANKGRIPEKQITIRSALCLYECDRAPCSKEGSKLHLGKELNWINRIVKE